MIGGSGTKNLFNITKTTPFVRAIRQCFLTAFDTKHLKLAIPMTHDIIDQMIDCIEAERSNGAVDMQQLCTRFTLDIIGRVALDVNAGGLDGSRDLHRHLIEVGRLAVEEEVNPLKLLYCTFFPFTPMSRLRKSIIDDLTAEWDRVTEDVLSRDDPPQGEMPFWHTIRSLIDPDTGKAISYENLRAEVASVVTTGMDTTGHQLAWILALLASHPHVVENILKELKDKGPSGSAAREIRMENLTDLPYLYAVVKEGMRICDVITGTFARVTTKDMDVLGYRVPPGTEIALASNRWLDAEDDWKSPKEFRPERWLNGEDTSQKHYLGFSHGPRDCVGQRLALLQMRLAVVRLVEHYTLSLTIPFGDLMMRARNSLVTESMDGIWIKIHPRVK